MAINSPKQGEYDFNLGIDPEIIKYIQQSHAVQARVSPTRCYLLKQKTSGDTVPGTGSVLPISTYLETSPNYRAQIWPTGSVGYPDTRPFENDGKGNIEIFIDSNPGVRILEVEDLYDDSEFAIVERKDVLPRRVEVVFNEGFNASAHTIEVRYSTIGENVDNIQLKDGLNQSAPFGWEQYINDEENSLQGKHQILVRTPLTTRDLVINEEGAVRLKDNQCWMEGEPYVMDGDIIVVPPEATALNRELRFEVVNKQDSWIQGTLISQRFKITLLEEDDTRYEIPYITD